MITLNQLATEVIRGLVGGNKSTDSKIERREVILRLRQKSNELLKFEQVQKYALTGQKDLMQMGIATYECLVYEEGKVTLPEFYQKIVAVYPCGGKICDTLIQMNDPYVSSCLAEQVLCGTECDPDSKVGFYYVEQFSLIIKPAPKDGSKWTVKLFVMAPDSVDVDDPLPIMPEIQSNLINMVIQDMQPQVQTLEDVSADQNNQPIPING